MQYQNPTPDDSVNVSQEHPLKEFAQLLIGISLVSLLLIWLLSASVGWLARFVPFEYEQSLVGELDINAVGLKAMSGAEQAKLQALADRLSVHMDLPSGMKITVHYVDDETVNALATLGGNVVFFSGLVNKLDSEQSLAMVMAHEIAHVKLRHSIAAAGKGLTIGALLAFVTNVSGSSAGSFLLGNSSQLSVLSYSRAQESAADELAAAALYYEYGDVAGAIELFSFFSELENESLLNSTVPTLYRSHPFSDQRAEALRSLASQRGWPLSAKEALHKSG